MYASGDMMGITFCAPILKNGDFYAALCIDLDIIQEMQPLTSYSEDSLSFLEKSHILQRDLDFTDTLKKIAVP